MEINSEDKHTNQLLNKVLKYKYYSLGKQYQEAMDYDQAITVYKKALRIDPDYIYVLNNCGLAYGDKGLYEEGIAELKIILKLNPKLRSVRLLLEEVKKSAY